MPEKKKSWSANRFVLLVDHGSRAPGANARLGEIGEQLKKFLAEQAEPWVVRWAHMELAAPDIPTALSALVAEGAKQVLVVPCMLSSGKHVSRDIPGIVAESSRSLGGVSVTIAPPLSELPGFVAFLAHALSQLQEPSVSAHPEMTRNV